jgi:hypothetical protein
VPRRGKVVIVMGYSFAYIWSLAISRLGASAKIKKAQRPY